MEKYSYSKIKCFLSCPLCFYKRYFEKPEKEQPWLVTGHGTSEFGSFVHSILENYEKGNLETFEMLPYYQEHYNENVVSTFEMKITEDFTKDFSFQYYSSGEEYLKTFNGFNNFNILEAEYEFEEPIDNKFIFTGKIDLIAEDDEKHLIVIDHKSKNGFKNKAELDEYAVQLYLYSYAVEKKYGRLPDILMFNVFRKKKWETIKFDKNRYKDSLSWLKTQVDTIENCFDFPSIPNTFYCWNFCQYREANFEECKKG